MEKSRPDFSNLFLNSGAHFQHHYMFNSQAYNGDLKNPKWYCPPNQDPLFEILNAYDRILGRLTKLPVRLIVVTGLHQQPHKHLTYYWRIKEHQTFLEIIGVQNYSAVIPRMSRDFLIEFASEPEALKAETILASYKADIDGLNIFTIDNRGKSLFIELTYPNDIDDKLSIVGEIKIENFKKYIAFVAIKNGEHNGVGYIVDSENRIPKQQFPLKEVYSYIKEDFEPLNLEK